MGLLLIYHPCHRTALKYLTKDRIFRIITDTGFGFAFVSFLFYSTTGVLGACTTLASLLLITAVKLKYDTSHMAWIRDPRTPLRISGFGLLFLAFCTGTRYVVGTAEASVAASGASVMTAADIAPFFCALFFGTANMLLASQLADREQRNDLPLSRNPETFLFMGYIGVGFMSGVHAVYAMPLVLLAFILAMYNYRTKKEVTNGHPLLIYAVAELLFAVFAFHEGKMLIVAADTLCALCLVRVDMLLSPQNSKIYAFVFSGRQK